MKRIIVIGSPGSGKSTFSLKLHDKTGIPITHLDMLNWNADKTIVSKEVFDKRLEKVLQTDSWIIDGNYGRTMEQRLIFADTVFFLDYKTDVCINGVLDRQGKARPDMPWIETEIDEEFMEFIRQYNTVSRPRVIELLTHYNDRDIHIFKNRQEAIDFLTKL